MQWKQARQLSCKMRFLGEIYVIANTRTHLQLHKSQSLGLPLQAEACPVRAFIGLKAEVEGTSTFKLLSILSLWDMQVFTSLGDCGFVIDDIRYICCVI